jgi:hypothetical protein
LFPDDVDLRAINLNFLDSKNDDKEDKDYWNRVPYHVFDYTSLLNK